MTFDDGFDSVRTHAAPILDELGLPATVFVPTDWPGRSDALAGIEHWADTPFAHELQAMSWDELRALSARGWEIGAHTCSHPHLLAAGRRPRSSASSAKARATCEREIGRPCRSVAYPFGDANERIRAAAAAAGYEAARRALSAARSPRAIASSGRASVSGTTTTTGASGSRRARPCHHARGAVAQRHPTHPHPLSAPADAGLRRDEPLARRGASRVPRLHLLAPQEAAGPLQLGLQAVRPDARRGRRPRASRAASRRRRARAAAQPAPWGRPARPAAPRRPPAAATLPTAVATTGSRAANASKSTCGRPSVHDTWRSACAAR